MIVKVTVTSSAPKLTAAVTPVRPVVTITRL